MIFSFPGDFYIVIKKFRIFFLYSCEIEYTMVYGQEGCMPGRCFYIRRARHTLVLFFSPLEQGIFFACGTQNLNPLVIKSELYATTHTGLGIDILYNIHIYRIVYMYRGIFLGYTCMVSARKKYIDMVTRGCSRGPESARSVSGQPRCK